MCQRLQAKKSGRNCARGRCDRPESRSDRPEGRRADARGRVVRRSGECYPFRGKEFGRGAVSHLREENALDRKEASSPIPGDANRSGDVALRSGFGAKSPPERVILSRGAAIRYSMRHLLALRLRWDGGSSRFGRRSFNPGGAPPRSSPGKARSDSGNTRSRRSPSLTVCRRARSRRPLARTPLGTSGHRSASAGVCPLKAHLIGGWVAAERDSL